MKTAILLVLIASLSACVHTTPADELSAADHAAVLGPEKDLSKGRDKNLDRPEIEQRAKHYESEGHGSEEAQAMAQIEYLKSAP